MDSRSITGIVSGVKTCGDAKGEAVMDEENINLRDALKDAYWSEPLT